MALSQLQNRPLRFEITVDRDLLQKATHELAERGGEDGCYGYFPGSTHPLVRHDLPHSAAYRAAHPDIELYGLGLTFSFLRVATRAQTFRAPFHLDGNASSGLLQPNESAAQYEVRALCNVHEQLERHFKWVQAAAGCVLQTVYESGYYTIMNPVDELILYEEVLPPLHGSTASGVLFAANRVPHRGDDGQGGHAVLSYGGSFGAA